VQPKSSRIQVWLRVYTHTPSPNFLSCAVAAVGGGEVLTLGCAGSKTRTTSLRC
jgi:hypothetical protein